jgi:HEAT repeat protein
MKNALLLVCALALPASAAPAQQLSSPAVGEEKASAAGPATAMTAPTAGLEPALAPVTPPPSRVDELISKLSGFDFEAIRAAGDELRALGASAVPAVLRALENQDPGIRKEAALILSDLKIKEAVKPIGRLLNDSQYWVARSAAYALRNLADRSAIEPLIGGLSHADARVRDAVLDALDELMAKSAIPAVARAMLNDYDQYVRWHAMTVLRELEKGAEIVAITAALKDSSTAVGARRNAATLAGNLRAESVVPLLLAACNDQSDPQTRWLAVEAVGKIGDRRILTGVPAEWRSKPKVIALDPSVIAAVEAKLQDPHPDVKLFAVSALGKIGGPGNVPALAAAARTSGKTPPSSSLRKNVVRSLGRIGGKEASEAVRGFLSDRDLNVRAMAAETLAALKAADSVESLKRLLSDASPAVRAAAIFALGELGAKSESPAIANALKDQNFWVKQEAERAGEKIK